MKETQNHLSKLYTIYKVLNTTGLLGNDSAKEILAAINIIKKQSEVIKGLWHSCDDCLPSDDRDVLVQLKDGRMAVDSYMVLTKSWSFVENELVEAWMELPEKWRKE